MVSAARASSQSQASPTGRLFCPTSQVPSPCAVTARAAVRRANPSISSQRLRIADAQSDHVRSMHWVATPLGPLSYRLGTAAAPSWRPDRLKATALMTDVPASIPIMMSRSAMLPPFAGQLAKHANRVCHATSSLLHLLRPTFPADAAFVREKSSQVVFSIT